MTDLGSDEEEPDKVEEELEGERGGNYGELERGKDIMDEEVSTEKAIRTFMDMESKSEAR